MSHYVLMYHPKKDDFDNTATEEEIASTDRHFEYLKEKTTEGKVVLAGRTIAPRFGIAVVDAESENEAKQIMTNDPVIKEGVFNGELLPFRLALLRGEE
jgi:uncharacterized protein YciI